MYVKFSDGNDDVFSTKVILKIRAYLKRHNYFYIIWSKQICRQIGVRVLFKLYMLNKAPALAPLNKIAAIIIFQSSSLIINFS